MKIVVLIIVGRDPPGGQAQDETWLTVVQMAVGAQMLSKRHGSMQWFWMHALFVEQSGLMLHSTVSQRTNGSPMRPEKKS